ncbi:MAG: carboxypeptidase regulatory-like domain-containing protein [Deltaproteobacteria bacterium]|nr:carboxypeptidase regulatory-like domain-containing protein [Deltaproteobacteria bacterium]
MKNVAKLLALAPLAVLLSLAACSSDSPTQGTTGDGGVGGGGTGGAGGGGTPAPAGVVNGIVVDIGTGARLSGVSVTGPSSTVTDAKGEFSLSGVPAGEVVLSLSKEGYAPGFATVNATAAGDAVLAHLKAQPPAQSYDPTKAATLSQTTEAGPYAVILQPNSLDTTATSIAISITPLDPTKEKQALPGSLVAGGADPSVLLPVTFAEFSLIDTNGKRVNLKSGANAIVELPIPPKLRSTYPAGAKIHCYAYDPATGKWEDFVEGTVQLSSVDGTSPVLAASIRHFSWYGGAPQGNKCADIYVKVVSAVDGKPLPNARVEASPGTTSYTDLSGSAKVIGAVGSGSSTFTAYQTGYDMDGSLTGMPGAKYIEFGEVEEELVGLVPRPCSGGASNAPTPMSGGAATDPVVIPVGIVTGLLYEATAAIVTGSGGVGGTVVVDLQQGVPGPDGKLENPIPATGAKIYIGDGTGTPGMMIDAGEGSYYFMGGNPAVVAGKSYTLTIDADGNGSIDGSASAYAVGTLAWINPTAGASVAAAGFTVSWSDTGTLAGNPAYAPVYEVVISEGSGKDSVSYIGTDRQFVALSDSSHGPLLAGSYTANLIGFSGTNSGGGGMQIPNNITGSNVTGSFFSVSNAGESVTFQVQ